MDKAFVATNELRILSLNVHKFISPISRKNFFNELRDLLEQLNLDVVCLQEFKTFTNSSRSERDTLEQFADNLWPHFSYGRNALYDSGHHGNAILSKFPIAYTENVDISNHRLEKRGVLWAEIEAYDQKFSVFCTHFDLTQWGRRQQLLHLEKLLHKVKHPLVICGDFNDWNSKIFEHSQELGLKEAFHTTYKKRAKTFPSPLPVLELDSIFYKDLSCKDASVLNSKEWRLLSDHLPLLATFQFL